MPQVIVEGYGTPQSLIGQGFAPGGTPVPPNESIFTYGWGLSQHLVSQGYMAASIISVQPYNPGKYSSVPEDAVFSAVSDSAYGSAD